MSTVKKQNDVPLPFAVAALLVVLCGYLYLNFLRFRPQTTTALLELVERYPQLVWLSLCALVLNLTLLSTYLKRTVGLERQGSKLEALSGKKRSRRIEPTTLMSMIGAALVFLTIERKVAPSSSIFITQLISRESQIWAVRLTALNCALAGFFLIQRVLSLMAKLKPRWLMGATLEMPERKIGEIILGTTLGDLTHSESSGNESWVTIPGRGVNGGIFISGSIGSGKTQGTILPYLRQICENKAQMPTMLAIDPKGTFLDKAEALLRAQGHGDRILKFSLDGSVSFNPVFKENLLRDANFLSMAEMVRSAAVNFMGKSTDSPFWDFSSASLIRNTIVYCAATLGYFTLLDLYEAIVKATHENLGQQLQDVLDSKEFDTEQRFNIERAIQYFQNEYSQLEDRVRTGIVATSTAFINQFQEYSASKVFCPAENARTIVSMDDLVRSGKIILFDIQRPGLARSMGTFIKLHYEQAILNNLAELRDKGLPVSSVLLIDEYQDVVTCGGGGTLGDDTFIAKARESKPAVIVATQSVSSLINTIGSQRVALELIQNFRTRIACHSTDLETINLFRDLAGKEDIKTETRSVSETSQSAKRNLLVGGFDSANSNLNESVSQSKKREDLVTGKEFSRLRTFEAFAYVFDGIETKFMKLLLKPSYLKRLNTPHRDVLESLRVGRHSKFKIMVDRFTRASQIGAAVFFLSNSAQAFTIPNVCTISRATQFNSCVDLSIGACTCGFPPHPCASISYYVPQSFIEVWPEPKTSYFSAIPSARIQLAGALPVPFGAEGDDDTQSFHSRTIAVPLASLAFETMPAGGTRMEKLCFDGMSEHFGSHWNTGSSDLTQPLFLAWSLSPKACLLKGAATSITGESGGMPRPDSMMCSAPIPKIETFPPSTHSACNGWGTFYPRYGTYTGPASIAGALMVASRIKSLSSEVLRSMPQSMDEKWQMIFPQSSSCFREGQNIGALETAFGTRETMRLMNGKLKGYLFVIWSKTSACQEFPSAIQAKAASLAIPAACVGFP